MCHTIENSNLKRKEDIKMRMLWSKEDQEADLQKKIFYNYVGCVLSLAPPAIFAFYGMWRLAAALLVIPLLWSLIIATLIADYKALRRQEY